MLGGIFGKKKGEDGGASEAAEDAASADPGSVTRGSGTTGPAASEGGPDGEDDRSWAPGTWNGLTEGSLGDDGRSLFEPAEASSSSPRGSSEEAVQTGSLRRPGTSRWVETTSTPASSEPRQRPWPGLPAVPTGPLPIIKLPEEPSSGPLPVDPPVVTPSSSSEASASELPVRPKPPAAPQPPLTPAFPPASVQEFLRASTAEIPQIRVSDPVPEVVPGPTGGAEFPPASVQEFLRSSTSEIPQIQTQAPAPVPAPVPGPAPDAPSVAASDATRPLVTDAPRDPARGSSWATPADLLGSPSVAAFSATPDAPDSSNQADTAEDATKDPAPAWATPADLLGTSTSSEPEPPKAPGPGPAWATPEDLLRITKGAKPVLAPDSPTPPSGLPRPPKPGPPPDLPRGPELTQPQPVSGLSAPDPDFIQDFVSNLAPDVVQGAATYDTLRASVADQVLDADPGAAPEYDLLRASLPEPPTAPEEPGPAPYDAPFRASVSDEVLAPGVTKAPEYDPLRIPVSEQAGEADRKAATADEPLRGSVSAPNDAPQAPVPDQPAAADPTRAPGYDPLRGPVSEEALAEDAPAYEALRASILDQPAAAATQAKPASHKSPLAEPSPATDGTAAPRYDSLRSPSADRVPSANAPAYDSPRPSVAEQVLAEDATRVPEYETLQSPVPQPSFDYRGAPAPEPAPSVPQPSVFDLSRAMPPDVSDTLGSELLQSPPVDPEPSSGSGRARRPAPEPVETPVFDLSQAPVPDFTRSPVYDLKQDPIVNFPSASGSASSSPYDWPPTSEYRPNSDFPSGSGFGHEEFRREEFRREEFGREPEFGREEFDRPPQTASWPGWEIYEQIRAESIGIDPQLQVRCIVGLAQADAPQGVSDFTFYGRVVGVEHVECEAEYLLPDGSVATFVPTAHWGYMYRLREVFHLPGSGAWYSIRIRVTAGGQFEADYDYEAEPRFRNTPAPSAEDFQRDTAWFTRDEEHTPFWLKSKLLGL